MFKVNCYKYDSSQEANGYRGVGENDFSKYVQQGALIGEDLTQILDNEEITLAGLPFQKEFDPETKFIFDLVEEIGGTENILQTVHCCVANDTTNEPVLSDVHYFDHHISFNEPSVVAQKRLVDNISATYKLKDVKLEEVPAYPDTVATTTFGIAPDFSFVDWIGYRKYDINIFTTAEEDKWAKYFQLEGQIKLLNRAGMEFDDVYNNIENFQVDDGGVISYKAKVRFPKMAIYGAVSGDGATFEKMGYASLDYTIEEFEPSDLSNPTNTITGQIISNSNLSTSNAFFPSTFPDNTQWLPEESVWNAPIYRIGIKKYTDTSMPTPIYETLEFDINPNKNYKFSILLHQFNDNIPSGSINQFYKSTNATPIYFARGDIWYTPLLGTSGGGVAIQSMVYNQTAAFTNYYTYNLNDKTLVYSSSTPYSALALLQKAIINSSIYEKEDGVYIADVNNSKLPFYIDTNFVDELSSTAVVENFYNQKNLWEIMVEVGNYIHAIPELTFGSDDRFMITFNRLGRTDLKENNSTKISIFNSRSVEDYICATSSYVTNMVQLGGLVEEWVTPKTTNEQLIVANDTAEILVSKPIIELLQITVRRNADNAVADLTPFIYEENVYKTLSLEYDVNPNRGIAMYYSLGSNIITGGQYQLPQANTNIYTDYTFKKVIYSAYNGYPAISPQPTTGYWSDIKVSDYSFFVKYRTKDSVRQNHLRPDIRKYLINSQYDKYPQHNQYNNQTDVVVDSIKFGNNMYGKLIKTGNSSYTTTEWNDNYNNLKHKGELYRINDELYYVAKARHTIFSSYILSEIVYSKDYNELSNIIGIPSEPRFYEISEQSLIWRELALNDLLLLTDNQNQLQYNSNYIFNADHLADLVLSENTDFAKYALTVYKGDKDTSKYNQTIGTANLYKEVINPINAYSSESTLTYEWDMIDNYSAGDQVVSTEKENYSSLLAVPYTDIYGKSALLDFYVLGGIGNVSATDIQKFPQSPIKTKDDIDDTRPFIGDYDILATNVKDYDTNYNGRGIGLLKDCREALSINYNLQLITNSDTFVLSPYFFLPNKTNLKIVLLSNEVNKLSTGYISDGEIITPLDAQGNALDPKFTFNIDKTLIPSSWDPSQNVVSQFGINLQNVFQNVANEHFTDTQGYVRVKAIAIICDVSLNAGESSTSAPQIPYKTQFIVARNIPSNWNRAQALSSWLFGAPKENIFTNKQ